MATAIKDRTIPTLDTLVKYDNPVLDVTHPKKASKETGLKIGATVCKVQTTAPIVEARHETIEVLNRILPPKQWEEDGQTWKQQVSSIPVSSPQGALHPMFWIRDELKMTLAAYQILYQSSIAFGMRKALQAEQGKEDLIAAAAELRVQKAELEKTVAELKQKYDQAQRRSSELREAEEKKHAEEIQFLKKTNQQLKTQLEGIIAPKR